eukprot:5834473-Prymnesium_polylepis.1
MAIVESGGYSYTKLKTRQSYTNRRRIPPVATRGQHSAGPGSGARRRRPPPRGRRPEVPGAGRAVAENEAPTRRQNHPDPARTVRRP